VGVGRLCEILKWLAEMCDICPDLGVGYNAAVGHFAAEYSISHTHTYMWNNVQHDNATNTEARTVLCSLIPEWQECTLGTTSTCCMQFIIRMEIRYNVHCIYVHVTRAGCQRPILVSISGSFKW
jgi:hypothetical protein